MTPVLCNTIETYLNKHLLLIRDKINYEEIKNGVLPFNPLQFPELADTQTFYFV